MKPRELCIKMIKILIGEPGASEPWDGENGRRYMQNTTDLGHVSYGSGSRDGFVCWLESMQLEILVEKKCHMKIK